MIGVEGRAYSMSLALVYEGGRLVRGVTRGDGTIGEDVTLNVRTVRSVPLFIPKEKLHKAGIPPDFEVRGELLMLPLAEVLDHEGKSRFQPGDEIDVMREKGETEEGYVNLSHQKAQRLRACRR